MPYLYFLSIIFFTSVSCVNSQSSLEISQDANALNWPDTSNWVSVEMNEISPGLTMKLPAEMKFYAHEDGVTLFINEDVLYSIDKEGEYSTFDMKENREWLENSDARSGLVWLIDEENMAYFTGEDLSASSANKTTHSCYGEVEVAGMRFTMDVDGITIFSDSSYNLSQEECLMFILILKSIEVNT